MAEPTASTGNTIGRPVIAAGLCAGFPLLGGIIFYFVEKKDAFVRHWAVQSICFGATWFVFHLGVTVLISVAGATTPGTPYVAIPLLLLLDSVVLLIFFTVWIIGIIKVSQGERWEYPLIAAPCRRLFPTEDRD